MNVVGIMGIAMTVASRHLWQDRMNFHGKPRIQNLERRILLSIPVCEFSVLHILHMFIKMLFWWLTYLKNMTSSLGMMKFPTEWKVIKFHGSKPPSNVSIWTTPHIPRWDRHPENLGLVPPPNGTGPIKGPIKKWHHNREHTIHLKCCLVHKHGNGKWSVWIGKSMINCHISCN